MQITVAKEFAFLLTLSRIRTNLKGIFFSNTGFQASITVVSMVE